MDSPGGDSAQSIGYRSRGGRRKRGPCAGLRCAMVSCAAVVFLLALLALAAAFFVYLYAYRGAWSSAQDADAIGNASHTNANDTANRSLGTWPSKAPAGFPADELLARPGVALRLPSIAPGGRSLNVRLADASSSPSSSSAATSGPVDLLFRLASAPANASSLSIHVLLTRVSSSSQSLSPRSPRSASTRGGQRARDAAPGVPAQTQMSVRAVTVSVGGALTRPTRLRWALAPPLDLWRLSITNRDLRRAADLLLTLLPSDACASSEDCSANGECDPATGACVCAEGFAGATCAFSLHNLALHPLVCDARCSEHGKCANGTCICDEGFSGRLCSHRTCPGGCGENGYCVRSSAITRSNSNPNPIANNPLFGVSALATDEAVAYSCECAPGFKGKRCEQRVESSCDNNLDDDGDSLVDCADSDCCQTAHCKNIFEAEPDRDVLLRRFGLCAGVKEASEAILIHDDVGRGPLLSLLERTRFLRARDERDQSDKSVQINFKENEFDAGLISLVSGQVEHVDGSQMYGCMVEDVEKPWRLGRTYTGKNGMFYYLLNGGQSAVLRVNCRNRLYYDVALHVPPNEFVGVGRLFLGRETRASPMLPARGRAEALELEALFPVSAPLAEATSNSDSQVNATATASLRSRCTDARAPHNPLLLRPRAFTHALDDAWASDADASPNCSTSLNLRSMSLEQKIAVPDVDGVNLVWSGRRAPGYRSALYLELVPSPISSSSPRPLVAAYRSLLADMDRVHVSVSIAGRTLERTLEARENLTDIIYWDQRELFGRDIVGLVRARVQVGYSYFSCPGVVYWHALALDLEGQSPFKVEGVRAGISNWNLDTESVALIAPGLLYGADGSVRSIRRWRSEAPVMELQAPPQTPQTPAGVQGACSDCGPDPPAALRRVHTIASADRLATNLLLGDRELIRLYNRSSEALVTVLRLKRPDSAPDTDWIYSLAAGTTSTSVYLSDPVRRTVHRLAAPRFDSLADLVAGFEGLQCIPSASGAVDSNLTCRDGLVTQVPLYAPSAAAEDRFGNLYILDGTLVRRIDQSGAISTLVGALSSPAPATGLSTSSEAEAAAKAVACGHKAVGFSQLRFVAPSALVYAPADHSLYVLDRHLLYRLELHYAIGYAIVGDARRCSSQSQSQPPASGQSPSLEQSDSILNNGAKASPSPRFRSLVGLVGVHVHPDGDVYLVHAAGVSVLLSATGELRQIHASADTDLLGAIALTPDQNTLFIGRSSTGSSGALLLLRNDGFERVDANEYRFIDRSSATPTEYTFEPSGKLVRRTSSSGPNLTLTYDENGISRVVIRHPPQPQSFVPGGRATAAGTAINISVLDLVLSSHSYYVYLQRVSTSSSASAPVLPSRPTSVNTRTDMGQTGIQTGPRILMRLALQQMSTAMHIENVVSEIQPANAAPLTDTEKFEDSEEHHFEYDAGTRLLTRAGRLHLRHHASSGRLTLATSTGASPGPVATSAANAILTESPPQQQWSVTVLDAVVDSGEALHEVVVGGTGGRADGGSTRTRKLVRVAAAMSAVATGGRGGESVARTRMCLTPSPTL